MGRNKKYNYALIQKICKRKKEISVTEVAKEYCEREGIEYGEGVRKSFSAIIKSLNVKTPELKANETTEYQKAISKRVKKKKRFMVTWAQAHTPVDKTVWDGMKLLAKEYKAEIIVIPGTYVNPSSTHGYMETTWDPELLPYLHASEDKLHPYLSLISDANVLPTAQRPLRGFEGITGEESSIVGHPRHHFEVVPTLPNSREKFMATTGSITVPNYRNARVGKKAQFHHIIGFLVVEIFDEENFVMRQVSANSDGTFQDLTFTFDGKKIGKKGVFDTIILGDLHLGHHDKQMLSETKKIAKKGKTKKVVCHDIFDGRSVNHHNSKDFVEKVLMTRKGSNSLRKELQEMYDWIEDWRKDYDLYIVPSNHNDWLDRWVRNGDGVKDVINAELFNEFQKVLFEEKANKGLIAYLIDQNCGSNVHTLHRNDSLKVKDHELNNHGDYGANGSRGSANAYKKLNVKIVSGHGHSIYTLDGAYGVGISTEKDHGYNLGLSSWTKSHGVINGYGKYQHLIYTNGKFTELI